MAGNKRGRKPWAPNAVQIEQARINRLSGANLDAIAHGILNISQETLHKYLREHPTSELTVALTRAYSTTKVTAAGWLYSIMADLDGTRTGAKVSDRINALKYWLSRHGGDEWKENLKVSGAAEAEPINVNLNVKMPKVQDIIKALSAARKVRSKK